jgi:hypothetical protein
VNCGGKGSDAINIPEFESICISQPVLSPHDIPAIFRDAAKTAAKMARFLGAVRPTFDPEPPY